MQARNTTQASEAAHLIVLTQAATHIFIFEAELKSRAHLRCVNAGVSEP